MKVIVFTLAFAIAATMPVMAGGYEGGLERYKLERLDGSAIIMYEKPDLSSQVLSRIPSGTVVKIIKGNPEGWILIEYNGKQGCVMGSDGEILCIGNIENNE